MPSVGERSFTPIISDLDIYRAANLLIERHGADAVIEAARRIDAMLDHDDLDGRQVWLRVRRAIVALQGPRAAPVHCDAPAENAILGDPGRTRRNRGADR